MSYHDISSLLTLLGLEHLEGSIREHHIELEDLDGMSSSEWKEVVPSLGARMKLAKYYPKARAQMDAQSILVNNENTSMHLNLSATSDDFLNEQFHVSSPKEKSSIGPRKALAPLYCEANDKTLSQTELSRKHSSPNLDLSPISSAKRCYPGANDKALSQKDLNSEDSSVNLDQSPIEEDPSEKQVHVIPPKKKVRSNPRFFNEDLSLLAFLEKQARTSKFMQEFDLENGTLTPMQRKNIVNTIGDGLLERHDKVSYDTLERCAEEISSLFPHEDKKVYFLPPNKKSENSNRTPPRGKLYDKVHNERYRRNKLLNGIEKKTPVKAAPSEEVQLSKTWLFYNNNPPDVVESHWATSRNLRISEAAEDGPLVHFVEKWPILKDSAIGPNLVSFIMRYRWGLGIGKYRYLWGYRYR